MSIIDMGLWLSGALAWTVVTLLLAERVVEHFKAWKQDERWRRDTDPVD
jgi:hypothetical protein